MSLDLEREETVQHLCRQFALDHLTTQELESRLEAAYRAGSSQELQALVAGLPSVAMAPAEPRAYATNYGGTAPTEQRIFSLFASVRKRGDWEAAEHVHATAIFGELKLDFREARISPGVTTVHVSSTFGSVQIIVPPGLRIECHGSAIMGEFSERRAASGDPGPNAPTLRIVGMAVFGNVEIKMRLPDDSR